MLEPVSTADSGPIASVENLTVRFPRVGGSIYAVNGVSLSISSGERVALVGESGCGKSITGLSMMRLLPEHAEIGGEIHVCGHDVLRCSGRELREVRGCDVGAVFQDPMSSLNPVLTIGEQLRETIRAHADTDRREARDRSRELLGLVGIPDPAVRERDYPHQLSGGMRQRVMIAMALALAPKLLVADEPTTALDVTTQAVILEQIGELTDAGGTALLLITHDLSIVAGFAERVIVMYAGFIVEAAEVGPLFAQPGHPYTAGLLGSVPRLGMGMPRPIEGTLPDPRTEPRGCPFAPRCPRRIEPCATQMPPLVQHPRDPRGLLACHNPVGAASGEPPAAPAAPVVGK